MLTASSIVGLLFGGGGLLLAMSLGIRLVLWVAVREPGPRTYEWWLLVRTIQVPALILAGIGVLLLIVQGSVRSLQMEGFW